MSAQRIAPRGICLRMLSVYLGSIALVISDSMYPGAMALHEMDLPAYSLATVFVKPITPACRPDFQGSDGLVYSPSHGLAELTDPVIAEMSLNSLC